MTTTATTTRTATGATAPSDWLTLRNRHTGERLDLRRVIRDGQMCLELKGSLPPRSEGPPLHIHYNEHEEGTVIAGTLSAELDGRQLQVEAGGTAFLPIGSAHRWWNAGDETLVFEGVAWPLVNLDLHLVAAFEILNSGPANRPPVFYLAHLAWRHRKSHTVLFAPRWLQAVLIPAIVAVGTILAGPAVRTGPAARRNARLPRSCPPIRCRDNSGLSASRSPFNGCFWFFLEDVMRLPLRTRIGGLVALCLFLLLAVAIPSAIGIRPIVGPRVRALTDRRFDATPVRLDRGHYLVTSVSGCLTCHSELDWQAPGFLVKTGTEGGGDEGGIAKAFRS